MPNFRSKMSPYQIMGFIGGFSLWCVVIYLLFPSITANWFVIYPHEEKSFLALFTYPFIHASKSQLVFNIAFFVLVGTPALILEGRRAVNALALGWAISFLSHWILGEVGVAQSGIGGWIFALYGVVLISTLRDKRIFLFPFLVYVPFVIYDSNLISKLIPELSIVSNNTSLPFLLGGLIAGVTVMVNSPSLALENLLDQGIINNDEYVAFTGRIDLLKDQKRDVID